MKLIRTLFQRKHESEHEFRKVMRTCSSRMLKIAQSFIHNESFELSKVNESLLNYLFIESQEVERILDLAHAQGNRYWYLYRRAVAFLKNFSYGYSLLLSLSTNIKRLQLLKIEENFIDDTQYVLDKISLFLSAGCKYCVMEADKQEIYTLFSTHQILLQDSPCVSFDYVLPKTRRVKHEHKPAQTVVALASNFLRFSGKNNIFDAYPVSSKVPALKDLIPRLFSTADVRILYTHFHNMRSTYDTFLYGSDIAHQDSNIAILHSHIVVIVQLLGLAVVGAHYYERHVHQKMDACFIKCLDIKNPLSFLDELVAYSLRYADRFLSVARGLCQEMIKQYAELGSITVQIPDYRGFHVRPSTLIAKIIMHYGSDVSMKLDDVVYDAKMPLELFRANEELNAKKRRYLFDLLSKNTLLEQKTNVNQSLDQKRSIARNVILEMFEKKQIIVYDRDFSFLEIEEIENEGCLSFMKRVITRYMAMGKIDIKLETKVVFEGDKRILQDIKILAEYGYGEDSYGNNIVLPPELSYLQKNVF